MNRHDREGTSIFAIAVLGLALMLAFVNPGPPARTPKQIDTRPLVIAASMASLTEQPPSTGREVAQQHIEGEVWPTTITAAEVRAIAREVSGSPIWAAWATHCWLGESGRGDVYEVGAVSPMHDDGSRDWGLPQINDLAWAAYGFDGPRAAADPRYAIRFSWEFVMRLQGPTAWTAEVCRV